MKVKLEVYTHLCATSEFCINGIAADAMDFGDHYDHKPDAEYRGCGDMRFEPKLPTDDVLAKYGITTLEEYNQICQALEDKLSFGECSLCV